VLAAAHARATPVHCTLLVCCSCAPRCAAPTAAWCRRSMAQPIKARGTVHTRTRSGHAPSIDASAVHVPHPVSFSSPCHCPLCLCSALLNFCLRPRKSGHKTDQFAWRRTPLFGSKPPLSSEPHPHRHLPFCPMGALRMRPPACPTTLGLRRAHERESGGIGFPLTSSAYHADGRTQRQHRRQEAGWVARAHCRTPLQPLPLHMCSKWQ
jgi:hypothetical protein